ncbi:MAG TPA: uroporphyrinogen decarboxylase [Candidatus Limnocylindria bacterium]|nr:uroporphyrinogen decarboxylase [Candidatus Limnocylindria bacterium]
MLDLPTRAMTGEERFLAALHHRQPDATPVWFMRQAGRALPAYRALRERHDILTLAKTPELCAEVTIMPVGEFGVDAAVMFADIMLPLEPMGIELEIEPSIGPIIHNPVRSMADVERLRAIEPSHDISFLMDAIRTVRGALAGRQAVIGFSGAPFTLACYLIEGRPSRDYQLAKAFMYREPAAWHALMDRLTDMVIGYLNAQVEAGAQAVQLFDSWVGALSPGDYGTYVQAYVARIFSAVHGAPTIHFGTGTAALLELMADAGGDVIGVDARQSLDDAWVRIGHERGIQGNLDATRLLAGWDATRFGALDVLDRAKNRPGHIFNLGHGVLPETDPDLLRRLVLLVHEESAR